MSASGFEFRPRPHWGPVDQLRLPCEKIFSTAEESNGGGVLISLRSFLSLFAIGEQL